MSKTFNSFNALKKAIQKEVQDAMNEVVNTSFVNAHSNVDQFYNSPEGRYQRTGQLAESPEMSLSGGGDSYHGEISLDTGFVIIRLEEIRRQSMDMQKMADFLEMVAFGSRQKKM